MERNFNCLNQKKKWKYIIYKRKKNFKEKIYIIELESFDILKKLYNKKNKFFASKEPRVKNKNFPAVIPN